MEIARDRERGTNNHIRRSGRETTAVKWAKQRASRTATACFAEGVERLATGEISTTPEFWVVGFTLGFARNHASIHFRLSELSAV